MGTVIIGGGIIGTSIAYYLSETSKDPASIHIVESAKKLFSSASGYAAGFLARDWFASSVAELGDLSFALHRELASHHNGSEKWGYAPSTALSLAVEHDIGVGRGESGADWLLNGASRANVSAEHNVIGLDGSPAWLTNQNGKRLKVISSEGGCAQVDPLRLCEFMLGACRARGVQVHHPAEILSLKRDERATTVGVNMISNGHDVPAELACKSVVIASGAWTSAVFKKLFPKSTTSIPISPLAGYSLLLKSPRHSLLDEKVYNQSHAIFSAPTEIYSWAPEIFSRKGGEIYVAGLNDPDLPLPSHATGATVDKSSMDEVKRTAVQLMGRASSSDDHLREDDLEISREAVCFRPVTERGTPVICRIPEPVLDSSLDSETKYSPITGAVFIAAGHGPWGISLSLGTGKVVAELLQGEKTSADISRLCL